jgi:hypothetical protein
MSAPAAPAPADKNLIPANALWVELSTRITTQRLHYRSGDEETAARSLYSLFGTVRKLMTDHPEATAFHQLALRMLNDTIRPYTARWHGWMVPDPVLKDKDGQPVTQFANPQLRRKFRTELRELQPLLLDYQNALLAMKHVDLPPPEPDKEVPANLGASFTSEILPHVWLENRFPGSITADEIIRRERLSINRRRAHETDPAKTDSTPITDAVGLALSGGGIKAATFSLGVVQELARRGIFAQLDYLSTVSGGGYCGSFLTAYLGTLRKESEVQADKEVRADAIDAKGEKDAFETRASAAARVEKALQPERLPTDPPGATPTGTESKAVRHLRNHSQYLLNGGIFGKLNMAGLLITGILANLLMLLPAPMFIALGLWGLNKAGYWGQVWLLPDLLLPTWCSTAGTTFATLGIALAFFWFLVPVIQSRTETSTSEGTGARLRTLWEMFTLALAVITALAGLLYALPMVVKGYLWLREWIPARLHGFAPSEKVVSGIFATIPILLAAAGHIFKTEWLKKLLLRAFVLSGPVFYFFIILWVSIHLGLGDPGGKGEWTARAVALVALLWTLWSLFGVNMNTLALHRYYRARLCECYLAVPRAPQLSWWGKMRAMIWEGYVPSVDRESNFGTVQQIKLSTIGTSGAAPYHLLNAIVNLPASKNRNLRGRAGDFFVMSREFCGSPTTGYVETKRLEEADPRFDLGTAMAISAAAANTNMGWRTSGILGSLRFIMTLLNVRLGYWLPNYRLAKKEGDTGAAPIKNKNIGSPYLLAEMSGRIQENMNHLNLSDGGHIENLGVYELLRRKCKFIISVDGGANRDVVGGDLQLLERYASIDFGIRLEYDLAEVQPYGEGLCKAAAILVKIFYSDGTRGWMIYLRPSITGLESAYIIDHWKLSPPFPYDSILLQVFAEETFEGYRSIGETAMKSLFSKDLGTDTSGLKVSDWFQSLAANLLPDNDAAFKAG